MDRNRETLHEARTANNTINFGRSGAYTQLTMTVIEVQRICQLRHQRESDEMDMRAPRIIGDRGSLLCGSSATCGRYFQLYSRFTVRR